MKLISILLLLPFFIQYGYCQNNKIYISKKDGASNIFTLGKKGYNYYHFNNNSTCDSLICYGKGLEICKVDHNIRNYSPENKARYNILNKAIRKSEKTIRKQKSSEGQFQLQIKDKTLAVKYYNAMRNGNTEIEITLLN